MTSWWDPEKLDDRHCTLMPPVDLVSGGSRGSQRQTDTEARCTRLPAGDRRCS